jgi:DNA-binding transcriptional LysR family regulator
MRLSEVDLNLLVALDALLDARNVTRAAKRVGLSPSAMSHALARLRTLLDDELLVRRDRGMVLTARADALVVPVHTALDAVARALSPSSFDPKVAHLRVVLTTSDYVQRLLLPGVLSHIAREAPCIELRVLSLQEDLPRLLSSGDVDLAVAPVGAPEIRAEGMYLKRLFDERLVCLMRRSHRLTQKRLTAERYAGASHALIAPRGREGGFMDDALGKLGLSRQVAVAVPNFLVAADLIASSDLVLTLPERVARLETRSLGLVVRELPPELAPPRIPICAIWHERTHNAIEHKWVRALFIREGEALGEKCEAAPDVSARG